MYESHKRSLTKGLTWRVIATLSTVALIYIITKNFILSVQIGFFDIAIKLALYYAHERTWIRVAWGRYSETIKEAMPFLYYQ